MFSRSCSISSRLSFGRPLGAGVDARARGSESTGVGAGGLTGIEEALAGGEKLELLLGGAVMILLSLPPFLKMLF